jgi:hypothetical protein
MESDKWADMLGDLDQDSDESDCGDDPDLDPRIEVDIHNKDISIQWMDVQNKADMPKAASGRLEPKTPAALIPFLSDMPKLERTKHFTVLESILEEDLSEEADATLQAMEVVPAALQALQTLQTLHIAEMDAIVKITETEVYAHREESFDMATRLNLLSTATTAT